MKTDQQKMWETFYMGGNQVFSPSKFAESILPRIEKGSSLLDVGCGNGRDSVFFAENGIKVTAIDLSREAVSHLMKNAPQVQAVCDNVLTSSIFSELEYDYIYSRFFIHALTEDEESNLLRRCFVSLKTSGKLFLETRCIQDELCGIGERISDVEWAVDGHYRRFAIPEKIVDKLHKTGFRKTHRVCARGFAPFDGADPVILRIIAEK